MERYSLWANEIVLKSSDNLDELFHIYNVYYEKDSPYEDMYIIDNSTGKLIEYKSVEE